MIMKYVITFSALLILTFPFSSFGQSCDNADSELETAISAKTPLEQIDKLILLLQRCPDYSKGLNNLGVLLEEQGKLEDAAELYRRAIHTDQRFPYPYIGLGDIYFQQKQFSLSAAMYNEVLMMYQSPAVRDKYLDLKQDIPRIQDRLAKCQASMPADSRSLNVVKSDVIVSQLKEESTELTRGIQYKPRTRPKIPMSILFEYNSADISKTSLAQMDEIGKALRSDTLKTCIISIEGHADAKGSVAYNQALSERRATSIKQFLAKRYGIGANRLKTIGYGKTRPIDSNDTDAGRAANRRVELVNMGAL
jgi:outer membrane protein OmpA-like peptidoglycan-associated protein